MPDPNQFAAGILGEIIARIEEPTPSPADGKDPAAVALGRKGGLKGGPARAAKMTKKERSESARKAAKARWKRKANG